MQEIIYVLHQKFKKYKILSGKFSLSQMFIIENRSTWKYSLEVGKHLIFAFLKESSEKQSVNG